VITKEAPVTFDEQVEALRKTVTPKMTQKKKADCTPAEWAARLEYAKRQWESLDPRTKKARVAKRTEYNRRNADTRRVWFRQYSKRRRREDIQYRLRCSVSHRMREAMRRHAVGGLVRPATTIQLLGCTIAALRRHLESHFLPGMSWDNWGTGAGKWHIDHVFPMAAADLTQADNLRAVCHYTNLRPLWGKDNMSKSDFIDWKDIESHFIGEPT
jgi:hypothetical protein